MAAVTLLGTQTFNTSSGSKGVTATPAVNDLIVIVTAHTGNTSSVAPTDTQSGTYSKVVGALKNSSADNLEVWVRNSLISSATSTTFTHNPGSTTGGGLAVLKVTGMTRVGVAAFRQVARQENQAGSTTPTPVFPSAVLTGNPVIGAVLNATNPAGLSPRSSPAYSERVDAGYGTPATGLEVMTIDSGETGSSIAWGGNSASAFASVVVELDTQSHTVRFAENFDGSSVNLTSKTPVTGHSWSAVWTDTGSDQFIANGSGEGAASGAAGGGFIYTANINSGGAANSSADSYQQAVLKALPDNTHPMFFVMRYADTSNFYLIGIYASAIKLYKCVSGTMSQVGSEVSQSVNVDDVIGVANIGSQFVVFFDNAIVAQFADSSLSSAGRNGLAAGDVTNRIDNALSAGNWRVDSYWVTYDYPNVPPAMPSLSSPSDGGSVSDTTPDLVFTGSDSNSNDIRYNVQVGSDTNFDVASNPSYRSGASTNFATASSVTLSEPSGASQHDILIATIYHEGNTGVTITPVDSNWTLIHRIDRATGGPLTKAVYWLRRGASAPNYQFNLSSSTVVAGAVIAVQGAIRSGSPFDGTPTQNSGSGSTSMTCSTLTTTVNNCLIVGIAASFDFVACSSTDFTNERIDGDANKPVVVYDDGLLASAGATGNLVITRSSGTNAWAATLLAIKPFAGTLLLNKVSGTDSGFSGSPDNSDPFTSGQQVTFTVQAGDALANGTYYWRVRGIDPTGSNIYGLYSSTRSFTVSSGASYSETYTETIVLVDSLIKGPTKLASETIIIVDTKLAGPDRLFSETVTIVDTVLRTPLKLLSEAIPLVDTLYAAIVGRTLSETVTIVETHIRDISRTLSETTTIVDAVLKTGNKTFTEAVSLADTMLLETGKLFLETITVVDTFTGKIVSRTLTEVITLVDTLIKAPTRTFADVVTIVDTLTTARERILTETVVLVDTLLRAPSRTLTDAVTVVDTVLRDPSRTLAEVVIVVDTLTAKITGRTLSEAITVVDSLIKQPTKLLSEIVTLVDTVISAGTLSRTLSETIEIVDTVLRTPARTMLEAVTLVDTVLRAPARTLTDAVTLVDTILRGPARTHSETVTLVDTVLRTPSRLLVETVSVTDTLIKAPARLLLDAITLVDTLTAANSREPILRTFTESLVVTDTLTKIVGRTFTESISIVAEFFRRIKWYKRRNTTYESPKKTRWFTRNGTTISTKRNTTWYSRKNTQWED